LPACNCALASCRSTLACRLLHWRASASLAPTRRRNPKQKRVHRNKLISECVPEERPMGPKGLGYFIDCGW
jgi:hypothetical protein